jgi:hypothetical protein
MMLCEKCDNRVCRYSGCQARRSDDKSVMVPNDVWTRKPSEQEKK